MSTVHWKWQEKFSLLFCKCSGEVSNGQENWIAFKIKFEKFRKDECVVLQSSGEFGSGMLDVPSVSSVLSWPGKMDYEMDEYFCSGPILVRLLSSCFPFPLFKFFFFGTLTRSRVVQLYSLPDASRVYVRQYANRKEAVSLPCSLHRVKSLYISTLIYGITVEVYSHSSAGLSVPGCAIRRSPRGTIFRKIFKWKTWSHLGQGNIAFMNVCIISSLGMLPETYIYLLLLFLESVVFTYHA